MYDILMIHVELVKGSGRLAQCIAVSSIYRTLTSSPSWWLLHARCDTGTLPAVCHDMQLPKMKACRLMSGESFFFVLHIATGCGSRVIHNMSSCVGHGHSRLSVASL
jgi:hypothetical protein